MKEVQLPENKVKQYKWFEAFSNPCYALDVTLDTTKLIEFTKKQELSFFITFLYIVVKSLNDIDEMRMRYVNGKPIIFDFISPAYTVMTNAGTFENVRHEFIEDFKDFYDLAHFHIESAKNQIEIKKEEYNPVDCWDEYYITCLPWTHFNRMSHPLPDDKSSLSIPRICWSKYIEENNNFKLTFNITVSHMFVEGYTLAMAIDKIQKALNNPEVLLTSLENKQLKKIK